MKPIACDFVDAEVMWVANFDDATRRPTHMSWPGIRNASLNERHDWREFAQDVYSHPAQARSELSPLRCRTLCEHTETKLKRHSETKNGRVEPKTGKVEPKIAPPKKLAPLPPPPRGLPNSPPEMPPETAPEKLPVPTENRGQKIGHG